MAITISTFLATVMAEAAVAALDGCTVRIFGGASPATLADPDSPTLLAEFLAPSPAFGTVTDGEADANAIDPEVWLANGTATHFRAYMAGSPVVPAVQGTVGVSGADAIINSVTAVISAPVQILSWHLQMPLA